MSNSRCRLHGGLSPGAPIKHGRRSKYLPVRIAERAEEALSDPQLISMREDIALIEAFIVEELESMSGDIAQAERWSESLALIRILRAAHDARLLKIKPRTASDKARVESAAAAFAKLQEVLADGQRSAQALERTLGLIEQKRRLAETELKRLHALGQFLTAQQANVLMAAILSILREEVVDPNVRANIGRRLLTIVGPRDS